MSHHWQDGFDDDDFQKQVVDPISAGNDEMKPALPDTAKSIFTDDDHVNVLLLSPKEPDKVPDGVSCALPSIRPFSSSPFWPIVRSPHQVPLLSGS